MNRHRPRPTAAGPARSGLLEVHSEVACATLAALTATSPTMDTSTPVRSDAELARALEVDRAVVSRLKKRGMPTHTVEAARAWRNANLDTSRRKDTNTARAYGFAHARLGGKTAGERQLLERLGRLMRLGDAALAVSEFELVRAEIQRAMSQVPEYLRPAAPLSARVLDALALGQFARLGMTAEEAMRQPTPVSARIMQPESEFHRSFWYRVCADEPV